MDRRDIIGLGLAAGFLTSLAERASAQVPIAPSNRPPRVAITLPGDGSIPGDPTEVVTLWPGIAPGGEGLDLPNRVVERGPPGTPNDRVADRIGKPTMVVFRPANPDGSAIIIAPGGGYMQEQLDLESYETARRLNESGVTCFVLRYRLPDEGWKNRSDVPLQDAQRSIRLVRANAAKYGIDPGRVGFLGFSSGGHVTSSIATRFAAKVYEPVDAADTFDPKPAFAVPMYPVVTMGDGAHRGSRRNLLGDAPTPEQILSYSPEKNVPANAPPCFICLAENDPVVRPLENGVTLYQALKVANIPAELHVFDQGGHGFGIGGMNGKPGAIWPQLLLAWGASHGFFKNTS